MSILVTGGAGYIGSHMVDLLRRTRNEVVIIDDLRTGHRAALPEGVPWLNADVADRARVVPFLKRYGVDAIFHFAALIQVAESMIEPRRYYVGNLAAGVALLESALDAGVTTFVLSSTAAVYGVPSAPLLTEDHPVRPINVYGETKLALERVLASYAAAYGLRYAALRYFNAAGADPEAGLGERHEPESHLVPIVLEAALGRRRHVTIFGDEYPTPDGTCVRDYIHVKDLCDAHVAARAYLDAGGESGAFNLGTGRGYSVREVIEAARRVSGRDVSVIVGPRRPGDPPTLVASPTKAETAFGWRAERSALDRIVTDAWRWHSRVP